MKINGLIYRLSNVEIIRPLYRPEEFFGVMSVVDLSPKVSVEALAVWVHGERHVAEMILKKVELT